MYGDERETWHTLSECLWTSASRIPGKVAINNNGDYTNLKGLFVDILGVPVMTLRMLYNKLSGNTSTSSISEVKADLLEFSARLPTSNEALDPTAVRDNKIFPVKFPGGEVRLLERHEDFVIGDRKLLAEEFAGRAKMLDFDLSEVHRLEHFIRWANLEGYYLSGLVKETSVADRNSIRPISEPDRALRRRAYALLWYRSPFS